METKFQEVLAFYEAREGGLQAQVTRLARLVTERLREPYPGVRVSGRVKSLHSTYLKLLASDRSLEEIRDLVGLRVIVPSVRACYGAADLLARAFEPLPGGLRDYIEQPKPNGYQSLHLQLRDPGQVDFEVQIRTREMHVTAQTGSAAHYRYKQSSTPPLVNRWRPPEPPAS